MRTLLSMIALMLTIAVWGQRLKITTSSGTKEYSASQVTSNSPATFTGGTTMTIGSDVFTISDITSMLVASSSSSTVEANTVNIIYNGSSATVTMDDNVAAYVTAEVSGAHVSITQSNTAAIDGDEITYVLSGSTTDGSLTLDGSYKCTISLDGVTLTNPSGAAIDITNSKRIQLSAKNSTVSTLTDSSNGSQKACIYSKGQLQLQGKGTLNVAGNTKHAIKSGDYISVKNLTLNITKAVGDGINCNEYFLMKSGAISISGVGDEGIQCDLDGDVSTGETTDHEDEDSGNIYLEGGTLFVNAATEGIESKGELRITGGEVTVNAKDDAINAAGDLTISGGYVYARSTGNDGIDANGNCYIKGGVVYAIGSGSPEVAIDANSEQQKKLYVTGGTIIAIGGLESGASLTQSCYQASSWSKNTWYAMTVGSDTFVFQTPSSGGSTMVVSGASEPTLLSSVTVSSGTSIFDGLGYTNATIIGGSSVSISSYTGGGNPGGGGGPGGGGQPGGGGLPGGGGGPGGGGWH